MTAAAIVFRDVTIVPMDAEHTLPRHSVVVQGDRIAIVGPSEQVPAPPGASVIDGRGAYLAPGLCDMHVHLNGAHFALLCAACGVTTVRNMWGTERHLALRTAIRSAELLGPEMITAGLLLDSRPPVWPGATVLESAAEAEDAVQAQVEAGYDFAKVYNRLRPNVYDAVVGAARSRALPVAGHVPDAVGLQHALAARQASIEHLTGYIEFCQREDSPVAGRTDFISMHLGSRYVDQGKVRDAARRTRDAGTWNCPTLVLRRARRPPTALLDQLAEPEMRFVPPMLRARWHPDHDRRLAAVARVAGEDPSALAHGDAVRTALTRALHEEGARLLAGTDTANPFVVPGFSLHEELECLVEAGLTPFEALAAATRDAAEYLGLSGEFGTIALGCRADLLLLDGNPLEQISNTRRRLGVMLRGRWLPQAEIDELLNALAKSFEADRAPDPSIPV